MRDDCTDSMPTVLWLSSQLSRDLPVCCREGAVVPLRVKNGRVKADDRPGEAPLYTFPPRLSIYWDEE